MGSAVKAFMIQSK